MVSSMMRVGGLATGMDTDTIIEDLMKAQRAPLDKLAREKIVYEWRRNDYRLINSSLRSFRDKLVQMRLQSTYMSKAVTSSNEGAFTATAGSSATPGKYNITVTQLAEGITRGSQNTLADEKKDDGTTKTLKEQFPDLADSITFTLEGKLRADGVTRNSHDFTINTANATINTLVAEINSFSSTLGIGASYDSINNRFFLTTTGTGSEYGIKVSNDSESLLSDADGDGSCKLKMLLQTGTVYTGQNARFDFGDVSGMESSTNIVTVVGVTLNLKQGGGSSGTVTVKTDADAVYNSIVDFITSYNGFIEMINNKLSESRYRDYSPLTDTQKGEMSEKEIDKWEEYAKSGLLRNDGLLRETVTKMRSTMFTVVTGLNGYSSLSSIGINSSSYLEKGKLYVNEANLKAAINSDPEGVMNLFAKTGGGQSEEGIIHRLYDDVVNQMEALTNKAGYESSYALYDDSIIGKRMKNIKIRMDALEARLADVEDRYWKQFTAMERAINRLNVQSAWLAQQFGGNREQ